MSLYEHFRKDEHSFVDQVLDWKELVKREYRWRLSDFLDPRQQKIVQSLIGDSDEIAVSFSGGYDHAERKRAIVYPEYLVPSQEDFQLTVFEMTYPSKFVTIEHRDVLGSLMGLGMKREKFGDILVNEHQFQMILSEEVVDYVLTHFQSVGKTKVSLEEISQEKIIDQDKQIEERFATVSSMRIDTVIAEIYHLSRSKIKPVIEAEKVKVNWKIINDPAFQVQKGDILSVSGKGRCEIIDTDGKTKKGKHRIILGFQK